ncbi:structure-specific endonuclease subunit slx1 [Dioscorea cayenensis subsp. rotundata]|uniref:Structure-specific endonuclease subunit slx1 n=1 Tax=Dioscorea cayennensis subsp. rotundata TaxID=55577 RepID=A0AB40AHU2_DIOCR|nr:structure-specific endonuclease subunit slx1 [Dioscorea cayenensis subsp. rotundata]
MTVLSKRFQSRKNHRSIPSGTSSRVVSSSKRRASAWSVYLIVSSRLPRTYVGVTTNFERRLKQHNGELRSGAKASSAGRPWTLACIIRGFRNRSEACKFESKWKIISRRMPRKKSREERSLNFLLQHRETALSKLKASFDCSYLQIEWQSNSS